MHIMLLIYFSEDYAGIIFGALVSSVVAFILIVSVIAAICYCCRKARGQTEQVLQSTYPAIAGKLYCFTENSIFVVNVFCFFLPWQGVTTGGVPRFPSIDCFKPLLTFLILCLIGRFKLLNFFSDAF